MIVELVKHASAAHNFAAIEWKKCEEAVLVHEDSLDRSM